MQNRRDKGILSIHSKTATASIYALFPGRTGRVGLPQPFSNNITSTSGRFARHVADNGNNFTVGDGGERGAFRHVFWQARITQEFSGSFANAVGKAHEGIGLREDASVDMSQKFEGELGLADSTVDMLNNELGRSIGENNPNLNQLDLARTVLGEFRDNGLWTASEDKDGNVTITRQKISHAQYNRALDILNSLNNDGFTEEEERQRTQRN
ncbi:MAG: hypothetical protein AAGH46_07255 [Bacteroidota bacterium]